MVYEHGINDMPRGWKRKTELNLRIYRLWQSMLCRCYSEKYHEKYPTYKNCIVCDKWLKLSGFVEDLPKIDNYKIWLNNPNKRIALDKDIKSGGTNKCYCLENCIFVTNEENTRQASSTRNNDYMKGKNNWMYGKHRYGKENPNAKKVAQYDLDGNLIKIWDYAKQISEELNISYSTLRYILQGKKKTNEYRGYLWKYHYKSDIEEE